MEAMQAFDADLRAGPAWVFYWVNFMVVVFLLAIPCAWRRVEARWAIAAMAATAPAMIWLHSQVGMTRILGIVHVVFWTPLAIYLWSRREHWRARETLAGKWIVLLFATILVSLAFDYVDVVRYLLGDRT